MKLLDFTNHQNREVRTEEVAEGYIAYLRSCVKKDSWYPLFHIAPPHGLLNDPNGLCQIQGTYHMYYQWFPLGPVHGLKHWYHVSTKDFVHYETHGYAMAPEEEQDQYGCFTGMTLVNGEERFVYYTGIDAHHHANVSYASMDDSGNIHKKGVLIKLPNEQTTENFRDPFVWKTKAGYQMLVGGENMDHTGVLLHYHGATPTTFTFDGCVEMKKYPYGYMLECPNYIELQDKGCLIFSPQGIQSPNKYDFRNVFSVVYMIGSTMQGTHFDAEQIVELDKGFDFYAPQVFQDEQGRFLLIAWLGNSKCEYPSDVNQWAHMLSIPRQLTIKEQRLYQTPLPEYQAYRECRYQVKEELQLEHAGYEIELATSVPCSLRIQNDVGEYISFSITEDDFVLDRTHMSCMYNEQYGTIRYAKRNKNTCAKVRMYLDTSSIEIFCEDGGVTMTARYYLKERSKLVIQGSDAVVWKLKPMQLVYPDDYLAKQ